MSFIKLYITIGFITLINLLTVAQKTKLYQNNIFSIALPKGWQEIPKDAIEAHDKEFAKVAPNVQALHSVYGFQLDSEENWFEYPYILIQMNNMGRIPEGQLKKLEGYSVQKNLDKYKKGLTPLMSNIQVGKLYYDKESNIIWLRVEFDVVDTGPVSGLTGIIPTEKGFIQLNGYSRKVDFSTYEAIFRTAEKSVILRRDLQYKPNWLDSLPPSINSIDWWKVAGNALKGAIILGIISLFVHLFRSKGKPKEIQQLLNKIYTGEDDFFRIVAFAAEADRYSKALFDGKDYWGLNDVRQEEIDNLASCLVKDLLPNYCKKGNLKRGYSKSSFFSNFIVFQIETNRVIWNIWSQGLRDLKSENEAIRKIGRTRADLFRWF